MLVCPKCGSTYTREMERCGLDGEILVHSATDPLIDRSIDRYTIREPLGSGGMATVYRASHATLERSFAIKVLHGELASDKMLARRFQREAKALSSIKHTNVVSVLDFGATPEGLLFMVMEFVDGRTLSRALREDGPFQPARASRVLRGIAEGLGAAHRKGYVHRDLKPGNVVIERDGNTETPKILDFGLVRILESEEPTTRLTQQGQFFGTPSYMAPEQAAGGEVGPGADLYALGVMTYVMLTGSPPFDGDVRELANKHITQPPPRPPLAYGGLTELVMVLLEKEPEDRPASATQVIERLDELGLERAPAALTAPPRRTSSRSRGVATADPSPLSEPVLAEEREFLTHAALEAAGKEDSQEIQRAALGLRTQRGRMVAGIVVVLLAVVAYTAVRSDGYAFRQIARFFSSESTEEISSSDAATPALPPSAEIAAVRSPPPSPSKAPLAAPPASPRAEPKTPTPPRPSPPPIEPPPSTRPPAGGTTTEPPSTPAPRVEPPTPTPPPPARPTRPAPAPRPAPPPPVAAPEPPPPVAAPEPPPGEEPPETEAPATDAPEDPAETRSFKDLDQSLGWALNERGLAWTDLAERAPDAAENWTRWFRAEGDPPAKILALTFNTLLRTVESIEVDRELLAAKLERAQRTLGRVPEAARRERWEMLDARRSGLERALAQDPLPKRAVDLAAEITLLEADAIVARREATRAPFVDTSTKP